MVDQIQIATKNAGRGVQNLYTEAHVLADITEKYTCYRSYREIASDYPGLTHGDIYRILKCGIFPKSAQKRTALNLQPLVPVPACDKCGQGHPSKHCPNHPNRPRRRRAISLTNPASAAATIRAHMAESVRRELVDLLYDMP